VEGNGDFLHAGAISSNGSDDRLKKNKITISNALSKVQAMEGFSYEWNEVAEKIGMADGETHLGLSAQTVQSVAPEVVVVNDCLINPDDGTNDYMTIRYERLVPMLVEAIKEQQGIIDQLKQRLDDAGL
jgi:alpha-L-fucosidase